MSSIAATFDLCVSRLFLGKCLSGWNEGTMELIVVADRGTVGHTTSRSLMRLHRENYWDHLFKGERRRRRAKTFRKNWSIVQSAQIGMCFREEPSVLFCNIGCVRARCGMPKQGHERKIDESCCWYDEPATLF